jgi:hypothetical protein
VKSLLRHSKSHLGILQLYIVAADFKKMLTRMNHTVSTHYLACFQRVKSRSFEPTEEASTKPFDVNDTLFLDDIPILAQIADTKIPNLEKMAQAAEKKQPFNLYNKDTCTEFHGLLCEVLGHFHQSLKDLKGVEKLKVKKRKEDKDRLGQSDLAEIRDQLEKVLAFGQALRAIVRGGTISVHLATIAPFLEVKTGKFWPLAHESGDDAEFRLLKPYSTDANNELLLPWRSFHDWLRLMVHHFDAIHVLDHHIMSFKSPSPIDISIKILYPSLPDEKMLPWKQLLGNERYFPLIPYTPDQPSAEELITFLSAPALDEDGNTIQDLIDIVEKWRKSPIETATICAEFISYLQILTDELNELKDSSSNGWKDYIVDILRQVEALEHDAEALEHDLEALEHDLEALEHDSTSHSRLSQLEDISNMLENLRGSYSLYKKLQPGSELSLGTGFTGSIHCEACAAVLNSLSAGAHTGEHREALEEFMVGHISIPCSNINQNLQYRILER